MTERSARLITDIIEVRRAWREYRHELIGFVPTMGALHDGHLALIKKARHDCDLVVVSIFVNPLQFGPGEDFQSYPRQLARDVEQASAVGTDIVFAPPEGELFPVPGLVGVEVRELADVLCGQDRPGHFNGVATIVVKLLNIVRPDKVYFGEKDWQQAIIIRRVIEDLNIDVEMKTVPTVRDEDGLATSSRNRYLSEEQRTAALALPRAVFKARDLIDQGERDVENVTAAAKEIIAAETGIALEYFSIHAADGLGRLETIDGRVLVAGAIRVGETRLIDNVVVSL